MKHLRFILPAVLIAWATGTLALAGDVPEHPLIRPYPGSVLARNMSQYQKFNAAEFYVLDEATKKRTKKTVKGKYWRLLYEVRTPAGERVRDIAKLEFFENFKAAALEQGGAVAYEDQGQLVFTVPNDEGGTTWCRVTGNAGLGQTDLIIVDEAGFTKALTFGPAELKAALDKDGRVMLYGILFDLDRAVLTQESDKQLQHIVSLLLQHAELKLEVQGHTDSQGADEYNLELSQRRAETVMQYLTLFGIEAQRLTARGYGETQPVSTNDTEAGRAKNRRVELVKLP